MGIILQVVSFVWRGFTRLAKFCGLWPLVAAIFSALFIPREWQDSKLVDALYMFLVYSTCAYAVMITIRNVIRFKNPGFCWMPVFAGFLEKKGIGFQAKEKGVAGSEISGMIFGKTKKGGKYISKPETEPGHALVTGGSRSGKTTSVAVPTLRKWKGRVFAVDIKPELHDLCKDYRDPEKILVLDPASPDTVGYDPMYVLRESANPAQAAKMIASTVCPLTPEIKDPYWIENAQRIFTAALLFWKNESFAQVIDNVLTTPAKKIIADIIDSNDTLALPFVVQYRDMEDKQISSIMTTLLGKIDIFSTDTQLKSVLDNSKWRLLRPVDLEEYDVFLKLPEYNLEIWKPFVSLVINQFLESFMHRSNDLTQTPILFMLDEFPRLGKVPAIENGLATLASKKIEIMLLIQSKSQLDTIYGKDVTKSIVDNCSWKAVLKATEPETQKWFSDMVGTYDKEKKSKNFNQNDIGVASGSGISTSTQETRIIKPEEFAYLDKECVLLSPTGYQKLDQVRYYEDKNFQ